MLRGAKGKDSWVPLRFSHTIVRLAANFLIALTLGLMHPLLDRPWESAHFSVPSNYRLTPTQRFENARKPKTNRLANGSLPSSVPEQSKQRGCVHEYASSGLAA